MKNTNNIIALTKTAIKSVTDARVARWKLGVELLETFFTNEGTAKNPIWISNKTNDKTATTVYEFAQANYKKVGKPTAKALEVFYGEAIRFAKQNKTVESAMKETIKGKKPKKTERFNAKKSADTTIARLGESNARKVAKAILAELGE